MSPFPSSVHHASRAEIDDPLEVVSGALPADLDGHAFVIGALPYEDGSPPFLGDGMIYRLSFRPDQVHLRSQLVRTDCFLVDEAAAADPRLAFHNSGFVRLSPAFGARNFGNTAITPIQDGRLLACYDGGRPWEIDPVTLQVRTAVGSQDRWRPMLPPVSPSLNFFTINMATAHPAHDAREGVTYLVNYATPMDGVATSPFIRLLWWDGNGEPEGTDLVDERGEPVILRMSCHQMQVTDSFVILLDGAFLVEPEQSWGGHDVVRPQLPESVLYIVRKSELRAGGTTVATRVVVPAESAHFLADRSDDGRHVTVLLVHNNSADPSEVIRPDDTIFGSRQAVDPAVIGMTVGAADQTMLGRYVIDTRERRIVDARRLPEWSYVLWSQDERRPHAGLGTTYWSTFGFDPGLLTERMARLYADHPHRQVALDALPRQVVPPQLLRVDLDQLGIADRYAMPRGHLPMSPVFVPRRGGALDEGYLLIFSVGPVRDELWIFDAANLAAGPRCVLAHDQLDVAFTLHTAWLPELSAFSRQTYRVSRAADYGPRLTGLAPEAQALARATLDL